MSKRPNLSALADAAGSVRVPRQEPAAQPEPRPTPIKQRGLSASRAKSGAKPITAFYPQEVRIQLKILAAEQGRTMENLLGEALNDLFAKYGKPEIVPVTDRAA